MSAEFQPAFDTPKTVQQVIEMLEAWGNQTCYTFNSDKAKAAFVVLKKAFTPKDGEGDYHVYRDVDRRHRSEPVVFIARSAR